MTDTPVLFSTEGAIARITLNRPERRNAGNLALAEALDGAIKRFEADDTLQVAVLHGAGPVFCAGLNLKSFLGGEAEAILYGAGGFAGFVRRARQKPVIAAVTGAALAGGFEIMLACDMVVAGEGAVFGLPEASLGLIAGGGGAIRLSQRVPRVLANEMLLTAKTYSAAEMERWGLLNRVVPDAQVQLAALELAATVAANAPLSVIESLALSDQAVSGQEAPLWQANDAALKRLSDSADVTEGVRAFFEKRPPHWSGQ